MTIELRPEANRKVMDLSGGFKRRVQVAKVFMIDTPIVFLDEFSTGMDPLLKRSVMARLRHEASRGRTIVLTTQILSEAEELCDELERSAILRFVESVEGSGWHIHLEPDGSSLAGWLSGRVRP